ncbi:MAG: ATP-binding protein [Anaerolineae bacterium]|nr:ATP-binding protein [Thermoflexales bacterium]MDW8395001.1 ATP-binding protein [Anaerolineae bacterium]
MDFRSAARFATLLTKAKAHRAPGKRKLPIGIQTFRELREEGYYYVDKTPMIAQLAEEGKFYFLARPRRFGKSLFLDTLAEAFAGNQHLFEGLYLEHHWDWSRRRPVVRISFAEGVLNSQEALRQRILYILRANAEQLGVTCSAQDPTTCLMELLERASRQWGERVVVLVDEYDKPILDNLTSPETARQMRDELRGFYSVLKGQDAYLRFVFLTGVTKFSKVSLFSGLNNLYDLTLDPAYATICGYTEADLHEVFAPEIKRFNILDVRRWYNGYQWLGEPVYNPFDVLMLFKSGEFRTWWFETGTPTFLVNWLAERQFPTHRLESLYADDALLSTFDVDGISVEAMLWQTGYLTIRDRHQEGTRWTYVLSLPNLEVRSALNGELFAHWYLRDRAKTSRLNTALYNLIQQNDLDGMRQHFERLYASIPSDWYRSTPLAHYEGYYASVFYSHLAALGLELIAEDVSNKGRCDLAVLFGDRVYLFEFKVVAGKQATGEALAQLKARDYAAKYRADGRVVYLIGVEFSESLRQVVGWECVADRDIYKHTLQEG